MQRLQQILCFNKNGVLVILRTVASALDSAFALTLLLTFWVTISVCLLFVGLLKICVVIEIGLIIHVIADSPLLFKRKPHPLRRARQWFVGRTDEPKIRCLKA